MEVENVNVKNWKSLIKPSKLDVQISDDLTHAKIIAEPLEKGYKLLTQDLIFLHPSQEQCPVSYTHLTLPTICSV